ncbi:MAG: imelysin family protein [Reichenbachiella sp.]|uniref:imelysin family protein n=1 Tax=Reichenbachiella sp. TaxID=2184521 RepID=UPI00326303A6
MKVQQALFILLTASIFYSCDSGGDDTSEDNFDRQAMLVNWADNIIIPAYQDYEEKLETLNQEANSFANTPTANQLVVLRESWMSAYKAWQWVAMFEIGRAETIGLQGYTNSYPVDVANMLANIESGNYNLELPSRRDQQGFGGLDYLINGLADSDTEIVARYADSNTAEAHQTYLTDLTSRLLSLTSDVLDDWQNGYRETFVNNDGSSATGAVNKLTNDYIFYFEKHLRASKVGVPAGVFSGTPDATDVEAYYSTSFSKALFKEALAASEAFFNGRHFGSGTLGSGFSDYLNYLNTIKEGPDLVEIINDQFSVIASTSDQLADSFSDQIKNDNTLMLNTYDELQTNVISFKIDMLQALNIKVDYVDADGD